LFSGVWKVKFIVSGGWMAESLVQMYNVSSKTWTNLTSLPVEAERAYHGCAMINQTRIVNAGGKGNLKTSWVERDETALTNSGGEVIVVGGFDVDEKFNTGDNSWEVLENEMKVKRQTHAVANVPHTCQIQVQVIL
jgi:hypothetical protein